MTSTPLAKLLSAWFGTKPTWHGRFSDRMDRFRSVSWSCVPPDAGKLEQIAWMNALASAKGIPSNKRKEGAVSVEAMCDLRPCYGEMFRRRYDGFRWWGWCDLDVYFSPRLDEMLAELLTDDVDVVSFKNKYLSGCLTFVRNEERFRRAFRLGRWREVLMDPRYHCWDESGSTEYGESFLDLLRRAGARVSLREDLYGYRAPTEPIPCWEKDGRLWSDGREVLLVHFMDDEWPIDEVTR